MTSIHPASLSDPDLLVEIARAASAERQTTSQLLALLAEVDTRKLYLGLGHSSMFVYCMKALHLSEPAAYSRITAARSARRFPVILTLLADGAVNLTTISLLAAHLTDDNHDALLDAACHKSKREVERLIACLQPQPDVASSLRRLPARNDVAPGSEVMASTLTVDEVGPGVVPTSPAPTAASLPSTRAITAPLAAERYLLRITLSHAAHETLERARGLLRHQIPTGDPAAIVDRALTVLVEHLERTKLGASRRPSRSGRTASTTRHVPAAVKRVVWARDGGHCAFVGANGRCGETGFLEFHHVVPFAAGGATDAANLELRCRAHNAHEAARYLGAADEWPRASATP